MVFVKQALYLQNQCHLYICSMTHSPKWHGPAVYILHRSNLQWIKQKKEPLQETSCASAFGKLFLKKWFAFWGFFAPFPSCRIFLLFFPRVLLGFFMKRLQKASQKVPKGCHRAPLKQMGILSGKIALLLKSTCTIYIYTYTFPQKNSTFSKECWVVCDAALAQQLRFSVDMYLAEACIYISILKGWLHCKSLWMPGFLPPNLPLFQEAACIFAECYLLCSKEIHLEGCCTRWRSARSLECRAFKMECQTFLKEQPLAKGWLYLLRWVLYLLINRLHFVWIQLCLNVNVAFFLKKIKKTALILCTLR